MSVTSVTTCYTVWSSNIKLSDAPVLPVFSLKYVIQGAIKMIQKNIQIFNGIKRQPVEEKPSFCYSCRPRPKTHSSFDRLAGGC